MLKNVLSFPAQARATSSRAEKISQGMLLRRIYRQKAKKKMTKKQVLAAIRRWKYIPAMSWDLTAVCAVG